jgi:ATP-binding cassette, subfamily F, member 3
MLQVKNIQKNYGSLTVLADVSFSLSQGQKVALVGDNGTGKTTLLKILSGDLEADAGKIEKSKNLCIGYLPQDTSLVSDESIGVYLRRVSGIDTIEHQLENLATKLNDPKKSKEYGDLHELYEHLGGYAFEHRIQLMLTGFGLDDIGLDRNLINLSSGQKSKIVLIGILLKGVDLLLLDEPTNNLDLPALIWLEDFIQKSEAACIIISHDRQFLDSVVRKIFELDRDTRTLTISGGTYSDYLEMKRKRLLRQKEEYRLQQEEIERLTDRANQKRIESARGSKWSGSDNDKFLRGFKRERAGRSSRVAKSIDKRILQMDKVEKPIEKDPLEIPLDAKSNSKNISISIKDVCAGYPGDFVVGPISLDVNFGNRVGILGLNGSGKSTLLKTITGQLAPISGEIKMTSGIRIGNMMQEHESLPRKSTLLEFMTEKGGLSLQDSFAKLTKFGFDERQIKQPIEVLSPGGRARLLLAMFSALSVNVLILDEPTNHLDLEALSALEEALESYQGIVLLVSHDRYFLEKTKLDFTYVLNEGSLTKISDYKDYVKQAEIKAKQLLKLL